MERCRVFSVTGEELTPCRWARAKKLVKENKAEKFKLDGLQCIKMLEPIKRLKSEEDIMSEIKISNEYDQMCLEAKKVYINGLVFVDGKPFNCVKGIKFAFPKILYQYVNEFNGYILKYNRDSEKERDDRASYSYSIYDEDTDDVDSRNILGEEIDYFKYGFEKPIEEIDAEENYELEVAPVRVSLEQAKNDERFFIKKKLNELKEKKKELEESLSLFPKELFKLHIPRHEGESFIREFYFSEAKSSLGSAIYLEDPFQDDLEKEDWDHITIYKSEINEPDAEFGDPTYRLNKEAVEKDFDNYILTLSKNKEKYAEESKLKSMKISDLISELTKQIELHGDIEIRSCELQEGEDYSPLFTIPNFELGSKFEGKKDFLKNDILSFHTFNPGTCDFLVIE